MTTDPNLAAALGAILDCEIDPLTHSNRVIAERLASAFQQVGWKHQNEGFYAVDENAENDHEDRDDPTLEPVYRFVGGSS